MQRDFETHYIDMMMFNVNINTICGVLFLESQMLMYNVYCIIININAFGVVSAAQLVAITEDAMLGGVAKVVSMNPT